MQKKILIISLGSIGTRHLRNARELVPHANIAVLRRQGGSDELPLGADFLFKDMQSAIAFAPDAVIIASPASFHLNDATPFISNNASLFLEKPLSHNLDGLNTFIQLCDTSPQFIMVGYILRFLPVLNEIKNILNKEQIGQIYTAHIQVGQFLPDWRPHQDYRQGVSAQPELGGGVLLELSHEIDYATWLFGHPSHIYCRANKSSDLDIQVEDNATLILEYDLDDRPKTVMIQLDFLQKIPQLTLQIVGSEGTLKADLLAEEARLFNSCNPAGLVVDSPRSKNTNEPYLKQFDFFFANAFNDYNPRYACTKQFTEYAPVHQAAKVVKLIEKARLSNKTGARV